MRGTLWVLVGLAVAFTSLEASAATNDYYVNAATGSDSNPGTMSSPWKTIQHCDNSFVLGSTGATCHVAAGTYDLGGNYSLMHGGSSATVRFRLQCDPGAASAFAAMGQCLLRGGDVLVYGSNVDFVGFDMGESADQQQCAEMGWTGPGAGALNTSAQSVHFLGNYCHDLGSSFTGGTGVVGCPETGALSGPTHGFVTNDEWFIGNIVLNYGLGYPHSYPSPGCNVAQGLYPGDGAGLIVEDNIVINVPTGGIQMPATCGAKVSNNVVISAQDGLILEDADQAECPGGVSGTNTFDNNYFGNNDNHIYYCCGAGRTVCTTNTPNYFGHNYTDGAGTDSNHAPFSCDTYDPFPLMHVAGSAAFVNYQTAALGDLHLKPGSPLLAAGTTMCVAGQTACTPAMDIVGSPMSPITVGVYAAAGGGNPGDGGTVGDDAGGSDSSADTGAGDSGGISFGPDSGPGFGVDSGDAFDGASGTPSEGNAAATQDSGCGCRVAGPAKNAPWLALLGLVGVPLGYVSRRRLRKRRGAPR